MVRSVLLPAFLDIGGILNILKDKEHILENVRGLNHVRFR